MGSINSPATKVISLHSTWIEVPGSQDQGFRIWSRENFNSGVDLSAQRTSTAPPEHPPNRVPDLDMNPHENLGSLDISADKTTRTPQTGIFDFCLTTPSSPLWRSLNLTQNREGLSSPYTQNIMLWTVGATKERTLTSGNGNVCLVRKIF